MKRWLSLVVGTVCFTIIVLIALPLTCNQRGFPKSACLSNMKQSMLAAMIYAEENESHLPPATTWMDNLAKFIPAGREGVLGCPFVPDFSLDSASTFGYAMNRFVDGARLTNFSNPGEIPVLFETGILERNANDFMTSHGMHNRHEGQTTVGFADGHVKSLATR